MTRALGVRVLVVIAIVAAVLWHLEPGTLGDAVSANIVWAIIAVQPVVFVSYVPTAIRFRMLTDTPTVTFADAYRAVLLSMGMNLVLPGRAAEMLKIVFLRRHGNLSVSHGLSALFLERVADLITVAAMALIGVNVFFFEINVQVLGATVLACFVALMLLPKIERIAIRFLSKHGRVARLRAFIGRVMSHSADRVRDGVVQRSYAVGCISWFLWYLSIYVFVEVYGVRSIGLDGAFILLIATAIGGAIPALPGGLGTYEAAAVFVLSHYGYSQADALLLAFALHIGQMLGVFFVALAIGVRYGSGLSDLVREMRALAATELSGR